MSRSAADWRPFVWAATGVAATVGFGLGGALFAAAALALPLGTWWPAAAQTHGHAQLFGWAGLMVLGVGVHFLPRLLGGPPPPSRPVRVVLGLLLSGFLLRALAQPALAVGAPDGVAPPLRVGLALSGVLELAGATLAVGLLARTVPRTPAARKGNDRLAVLPFFAVAFAALWLALAANAVGVATAALAGDPLVPARIDRLAIELAFHAFLVPIAVGMSARLFPLVLRTPPPRPRLLRAGLALSLAGLGLRVGGELGGAPPIVGAGRLVQAAALAAFVVALGVFARRRPLPRGPARPGIDPVGLLARSAYLWLTATAMLLAWAGLAAWGLPAVPAFADAERHALGAGFVTPLILGVGAHLLPGFARRPLRDRGLVWSTLVLGNAAALLRVGPLLLPDALPAALAGGLSAAAGGAGLAAIVAFGVNLAGAPTRPGSRLV